MNTRAEVEKKMFFLEIDNEYSEETGEEIGNPHFCIKEGGEFIEEAFWLTEEDSDESMRALGLVPIEEKYSQIRGYLEYGEKLYVAKRPEKEEI